MYGFERREAGKYMRTRTGTRELEPASRPLPPPDQRHWDFALMPRRRHPQAVASATSDHIYMPGSATSIRCPQLFGTRWPLCWHARVCS